MPHFCQNASSVAFQSFWAACLTAACWPIPTTVLTGVRSGTEFEENERLFRHPIPDAMWQELKAEGLLDEAAPVPHNEEKTQ